MLERLRGRRPGHRPATVDFRDGEGAVCDAACVAASRRRADEMLVALHAPRR